LKYLLPEGVVVSLLKRFSRLCISSTPFALPSVNYPSPQPLPLHANGCSSWHFLVWVIYHLFKNSTFLHHTGISRVMLRGEKTSSPRKQRYCCSHFYFINHAASKNVFNVTLITIINVYQNSKIVWHVWQIAIKLTTSLILLSSWRHHPVEGF